MRIKYSPVKSDTEDTNIRYVDENTILIDGEEYQFDVNSVIWPTIRNDTNGKILDAFVDDNGELCITVRRFYTGSCSDWDTGDYHDIKG